MDAGEAARARGVGGDVRRAAGGDGRGRGAVGIGDCRAQSMAPALNLAYRAKVAVYHPPVYRTGSNIPAQGSGAADTTDATGDAVRQAMPPPMVRKPPNG